jgi:hypothetical protein
MVRPVIFIFQDQQRIVGQSQEHQPIAVSLSAGKRGMGYELSSKFIAAT